MKRRILAISLVISLIFVNTTPCLVKAKTKPYVHSHKVSEADIEEANEILADISKITDLDDFCELFEEEKYFTTVVDDSAYQIPKDSTELIISEMSDGDIIKMSLPKEIDLGDGILTNEGTVVFNGDGAVDLCTQVVSKTIEEDELSFSKTIIKIDNPTAPKEYTFDFALPEGYEIITANEYNYRQKMELEAQKEELFSLGLSKKEYKELISLYSGSSDEIYIIDEEELVRKTVEAPWAFDANGNAIDTYYKIEHNSIIQVVDFKEDDLFPIIADPTIGQTESYNIYISNSQLTGAFDVNNILTAAGLKKLKSLAVAKLSALMSPEFVAIVGVASLVSAAIGYLNGATGKNGIRIYGTKTYKQLTNRKEGYTVVGWALTSVKMARY